KTSVVVDFHVDRLEERLPAEMETALYRIVQESLTNIAKHAHAKKVTITLKGDQEAVYATITDDGRGFNIEKLQKMPGQERGGWGLVGMYERAHL
ncbi:MAG TPA: ATP-binding protein, partial [Ktedonobacteraceae bacterium]|nr:ATP-binding protein [Ktedonobacteraceae bacterium]